MKEMSIQEIRELTLSTEMTSKSVVYRANKDTTLMPPGNENVEVVVPEGELICIDGCGMQSGSHDLYHLSNEVLIGLNADWDHYANPVGVKNK